MGNEMEKIEELQKKQSVGYGDETMAVQMQSPIQNPSRLNPSCSPRKEQLASVSNFEFQSNSTPSQNPSLKSDSCSSLTVSERKQLESSSKSLHQSLSFYCKVCQVPCSGSLNYKNHLDGKKHKVKLQELGFAQKDGGDDCETGNSKFWCETCEIWCMDDNALKQHLAGKRHKKMQEKLETNEGEELKCELCGIRCTSKELLQLHFIGKKHQAEVRKLEHAENDGDGAHNCPPKRNKLCCTWCVDEFVAGASYGEETFLERVEVKKREWQDLIRNIEANR